MIKKWSLVAGKKRKPEGSVVFKRQQLDLFSGKSNKSSSTFRLVLSFEEETPGMKMRPFPIDEEYLRKRTPISVSLKYENE